MSERRAPSGRAIALSIVLGLVVATAAAWAYGAWGPGSRTDRAVIAGIVLFPAWALAALLVVGGRRRPGRRARWVRLHLGLGAPIAGLVLVIATSGSLAVAARLLGPWEHAPLAGHDTAVPAAGDQPLDAIVHRVLTDAPGLDRGMLRIAPAAAEHPTVRVLARGAEGFVELHFDPVTADAVPGPGPLAAVVELHRDLLLPAKLGETLVAIVGVLLAIVLSCGWATRRRWRREVVTARGRRSATEIHKLIGAWGFAFGIVVALSGAVLGGTGLSVPVMVTSAYDGDRDALFRDVLAVERAALDPTVVPEPPLADRIAAPACLGAPAAGSGWTPTRITLAHPGHASASTTVELEGRGPWLDRAIVVRDASGHPRVCRRLRDQSAGVQTFYATIAIHYAELGGPARRTLEVMWMLAGFALAVGAGLGEALRQRRKPPRGRARPTLLVALAAGLPLAVVALLLATRIAPVAIRTPGTASGTLLLVWCLATLVAALPRPGVPAWRRARPVVLAIAAGLWLTTIASALGPGATAVDGLLAGLGALCLGLATFTRRNDARR